MTDCARCPSQVCVECGRAPVETALARCTSCENALAKLARDRRLAERCADTGRTCISRQHAGTSNAEWASTAETLKATGRLDQAASTFQAAHNVATPIAMRQEEARALDGMARCRNGAGDRDEAVALWQQALDLYLDLQLPEADAVRRQLNDIP